jgi:hypothetical protein
MGNEEGSDPPLLGPFSGLGASAQVVSPGERRRNAAVRVVVLGRRVASCAVASCS